MTTTPSSPLQRAASERALVLGGGGSTGNAWLIGVIAGLSDAGLDVTGADLIIGTSAGATAAAQVTGARPTQLLSDILAAAPSHVLHRLHRLHRWDPTVDAVRPARRRTT